MSKMTEREQKSDASEASLLHPEKTIRILNLNIEELQKTLQDHGQTRMVLLTKLVQISSINFSQLHLFYFDLLT